MKTRYQPVPKVEQYTGNASMSWSTVRKGSSHIKLEVLPSGKVWIVASETPEDGRGGKEVMMTLSEDKAAELLALLLANQEERKLQPA